MTARPPTKLPWSVPVRPEDVPETGLHFDLVADEPTRNAIAAMAGLRALPRFTASFDVTRRGNGLALTGEIAATVGQTCVVTLESLSNEVREAVDAVFLPPESIARPPDVETADAIDPEAVDEPEALVDGMADLGATATEFLLLAIDPYPRKPGAVFEPPAADDPGAHPFAALAALKKDRDTP